MRVGRQDDAEWLATELQTLSGAETITQIEAAVEIANTKDKRTLSEDLRKAGLPD